MIAARIARIPCLIDVTHAIDVPGSFDFNAGSDWDYLGYRECEFTVCDRRGRPAPWLERKMTQDDRDEIERLIFAKSN
jgi:hypothetical protein